MIILKKTCYECGAFEENVIEFPKGSRKLRCETCRRRYRIKTKKQKLYKLVPKQHHEFITRMKNPKYIQHILGLVTKITKVTGPLTAPDFEYFFEKDLALFRKYKDSISLEN